MHFISGMPGASVVLTPTTPTNSMLPASLTNIVQFEDEHTVIRVLAVIEGARNFQKFCTRFQNLAKISGHE